MAFKLYAGSWLYRLRHGSFGHRREGRSRSPGSSIIPPSLRANPHPHSVAIVQQNLVIGRR